jgi:hypothetical protein
VGPESKTPSFDGFDISAFAQGVKQEAASTKGGQLWI